MIKVRNIETGKVFDVIKVSGEYWIDETGYIESEQLGITWELIDDYKQLYEQQKQRADELEKRWSTLWQKLKYEYDIANNSTELRCFGMSLDIMHDLQEDNNA